MDPMFNTVRGLPRDQQVESLWQVKAGFVQSKDIKPQTIQFQHQATRQPAALPVEPTLPTEDSTPRISNRKQVQVEDAPSLPLLPSQADKEVNPPEGATPDPQAKDTVPLRCSERLRKRTAFLQAMKAEIYESTRQEVPGKLFSLAAIWLDRSTSHTDQSHPLAYKA